MQDNTFTSFADQYVKLLEQEMEEAISRLEGPTSLKESMAYSLQAGGKRIRPLLLFATIASFEKDPRIGLLPATALEMIHTYSLIHDDLPSMDDDDLRRGKPTNHKVFGEAVAILAGDALLTYSFELITMMDNEEINDSKKLALISLLAKASGSEGMVGGQTADIEAEGKQLTVEQLQNIHLNKTGKLLEFAVLAGAILANASNDQYEKLKKFAYHIGIAFQIRDDILDLEGSEQSLGKRVGSDLSKDKVTYPSLLTTSGAKDALEKHIEMAKKSLLDTQLQTNLLEQLTMMVALRNN